MSRDIRATITAIKRGRVSASGNPSYWVTFSKSPEEGPFHMHRTLTDAMCSYAFDLGMEGKEFDFTIRNGYIVGARLVGE